MVPDAAFALRPRSWLLLWVFHQLCSRVLQPLTRRGIWSLLVPVLSVWLSDVPATTLYRRTHRPSNRHRHGLGRTGTVGQPLVLLCAIGVAGSSPGDAAGTGDTFGVTLGWAAVATKCQALTHTCRRCLWAVVALFVLTS
jgi:hypothetical protein